MCVTLNSHSFHSSTSVTLHLKYYELVLRCVFFLFWSHTVSGPRHYITAHKSVFITFLKGKFTQGFSLPHSY